MVSLEAWELEAVRMEEYSTQQNQMMSEAIDSPSKAGSWVCKYHQLVGKQELCQHCPYFSHFNNMD